MKLQGKKALACLSLMLVVFSIVPSGALTNETDAQNATDIPDFAEGRSWGRGAMERPSPEMPEFETEEEEIEFLKEMMANLTRMRIDRTTSMLGDVDEIDNANITEESLGEQLSELEALLEKINSATTLEELKEIMSETMKMGEGGQMRGKGPGMEMPEFETEEEELEFVKARTLGSVERMIETLENTTLEETDSENITSDDVEAILAQLEDINSRLTSEDLTLEDIEEIRDSMSGIMESVRGILPAPANERGPSPGHHGCREEANA
jgi:hypothetical protein